MTPVPRLLVEPAMTIVIDGECHCRNQSANEARAGIRRSQRRMTDIGIAAVDNCKLPTYGAESLEDAQDEVGDRFTSVWKSDSVKAYDIAIREHKHDASQFRKHPTWCTIQSPESFIFGTPEWCSKAAAKYKVINKIRELVGDKPVHQLPSTNYWNKKKIFFVFFAQANDLIWLAELGVNLQVEFPNSEIIDLQRQPLASAIAYSRGHPQIGAASLFRRLGMETKYEHNGGNDAVYELRALLAEMVLTPEQRQLAFEEGQNLPLLDMDGNLVPLPASETLGFEDLVIESTDTDGVPE
ncbi:uncharacterized protein HMPREF1541_10549 [Cyphellophora europaea CBS 101466]|uniref:Gfd2/YDR514C-like C-terminal domain-containing protein n=1 Tax=Cyphellophora europaea (strain CBS 101466) TaxID=1220924 RepID=W2S8Z9_CYPE1|nr:uncharacterized protein HMPREF1541_10549 [Cyphellophora europaea CBS 101466]ETN44369.1 hypothetical protein HMPREF1541_10549 [Cyphellophora europaea CBS 101466]